MITEQWWQLNTVVSNHFHSVKNVLFSSAKPHDFDGMLGTGLPVSMCTTKTPIDKCHFNVTQLKEFFYIFCKRQISIKLFYLYQRLQCTDNYFFKIKFVLFLYLLLSVSKSHHERKTTCLNIFLLSDRQWGTKHQYFLGRFLGVSILQLLIIYRIYDYMLTWSQ
jgi:hypothetical protein